MSAYEFATVWNNSKATGSALLVHLALADCAVNGLARTNHQTLASIARVSVDSVARAINQLVQMGEIEILEPRSGNRVPQIDVMPNRGRSSKPRQPTPQIAEMGEQIPTLQIADMPLPTPQIAALSIVDQVIDDIRKITGIADIDNAWFSSKRVAPKELPIAVYSAALDVQPFTSRRVPAAVQIVPADVGRVLKAAGVPPNEEVPLYWWRAEHLADLIDLCKGLGISVDTLIGRITTSGQKAPDLRRIADLEPLVRGYG